MTYAIVKALHIIAFTCWFAGLFYVVRLFIYHTEAREEPGAERLVEQLALMQTRLWKGITTPRWGSRWCSGYGWPSSMER